VWLVEVDAFWGHDTACDKIGAFLWGGVGPALRPELGKEWIGFGLTDLWHEQNPLVLFPV
jgi:hypothetical protein